VEAIGKTIQEGSAGTGIVTGLGYGLGMAVAFGLGGVIAVVPSPTATDFRLRGRGRALARMLGWGLWVGSAVGLVIGGAEAAAMAFAWRARVPVDDDLVLGLLPGIVFGLVAGVASALIHWSRRPIVTEEAYSPSAALTADRRQYLALLGMVTAAIMVAFTLGSLLTLDADPAGAVRHGIRNGLGGSVVLALASCFTAAWPRYQVARLWLAARRRLPWRLAAFLEEARRIGVLRRVGATYQFRHASLQDRMAGPIDPAR
jgi:hypothetical protein